MSGKGDETWSVRQRGWSSPSATRQMNQDLTALDLGPECIFSVIKYKGSVSCLHVGMTPTRLHGVIIQKPTIWIITVLLTRLQDWQKSRKAVTLFVRRELTASYSRTARAVYRSSWRNLGAGCGRNLGAFAKLRKATLSFVISVRPSVCLSVCAQGTTRFPLDGFSWNFIFEYFSVDKIQVSFNRTRIKAILHENRYTFVITTRSVLLTIKNVSDNTHVLFSVCVTVHHWYNNTNNQLDATIIVLLIISISSTCFGRQFRQSSRALDCVYSLWYKAPTMLSDGNQ